MRSTSTACWYAFASILLRRHDDDGMQHIMYNEQQQPFCRPAQVECQPQGPIVAKVVAYRASGGGFLSLALESVAGSGRIVNVELRSSLMVSALLLVQYPGLTFILHVHAFACVLKVVVFLNDKAAAVHGTPAGPSCMIRGRHDRDTLAHL